MTFDIFLYFAIFAIIAAYRIVWTGDNVEENLNVLSEELWNIFNFLKRYSCHEGIKLISKV